MAEGDQRDLPLSQGGTLISETRGGGGGQFAQVRRWVGKGLGRKAVSWVPTSPGTEWVGGDGGEGPGGVASVTEAGVSQVAGP